MEQWGEVWFQKRLLKRLVQNNKNIWLFLRVWGSLYFLLFIILLLYLVYTVYLEVV